MTYQNPLDNLLAVLKNTSSVKSTTQAVEIISLLLINKYLELAPRINCEHINHNLDSSKDYFSNISQRLLSSDRKTPFDLTKIESNILLLLDLIDDDIRDSLYFHLSEIDSIDEFYKQKSNFSQLISRMVEESGSSGAYYTPSSICDLIINTIQPKNGDSIYDPACGTGLLLVKCLEYLKNNNSESQLTGKDVSPFSYLICCTNLLLGNSSAIPTNLFLGDSLNTNVNKTPKQDVIISNPPFGKYKKSEFSQEDYSFIEYGFLRHIMKNLKENGKAAIILPNRFFLEENEETLELKKELLENFNIDTIISLPPGVFLPYTAVKTSIIFFSKSTSTPTIYIYNFLENKKINKSTPFRLDNYPQCIDDIKSKKVSEHAWTIKTSSLPPSYNLLKRTETSQDKKDEKEISSDIIGLISDLSSLQITLKSLYLEVKSLEGEIDLSINECTSNKFSMAEICDISVGELLQKSKLNETGGIPVYGGNGIVGYSDDYKESGETIVIGKVGALCGNIRYVEGNICVTNNAMIVKNKRNEIVHLPYLARVLSSKDLGNLSVGTAQQYITVWKIKNIIINLPPLEIQIRLNHLLSSLDDKIHVCRKLLHLADLNTNQITDGILNRLLRI